MKSLQIPKMVSVFFKSSILACMVVGGVLSLNSCDKIEDTPNASNEQSPEVKIDVNYKSDNYLTFKNFEEAQQVASQLFDGTVENRNNYYAKQSGFVSMNQLFEKGIEEIELRKKLQPENQKNKEVASTIFSENANSFFKDGRLYRMNVTEPKLSFIVNRSGIVKIGHTLYQYNETNIKAIPDGNYDLVSQLNQISRNSKQSRIGKAMVFVTEVTRNVTPIANKQSRTNDNSNKQCTGFARIGSSNMTNHITGNAYAVNFGHWDYVFVGYDPDFNAQWEPVLTARGHRLYLQGYTEERCWFGSWCAARTTNSSMAGKFGYTINNVSDVQAYVSASTAGNGGSYGPNQTHNYGQQPHPETAYYYRYLLDLYVPSSTAGASNAIIDYIASSTEHKFTWVGICDCTITY
jgi:hypothetical protein